MRHLRDVHSRWGDTGPSLFKETKEASEDKVSKGQGGGAVTEAEATWTTDHMEKSVGPWKVVCFPMDETITHKVFWERRKGCMLDFKCCHVENRPRGQRWKQRE